MEGATKIVGIGLLAIIGLVILFIALSPPLTCDSWQYRYAPKGGGAMVCVSYHVK